jgi:hypothetical protein
MREDFEEKVPFARILLIWAIPHKFLYGKPPSLLCEFIPRDKTRGYQISRADGTLKSSVKDEQSCKLSWASPEGARYVNVVRSTAVWLSPYDEPCEGAILDLDK